MRKIGLLFVLLVFSAVSLGGCGDKEKSQAQQSWKAFKAQEIEAIKNAHADSDLKPTDFASRFTEVEDPYAYRFKGFIQFKKGNVFQELAYALVDGKWTPVSYDDKADIEAKKAKEKRVAELKKKILALKGQIASNEQTLERYQELMAETKAKKKELADLEAQLAEIVGQKEI